jgi:O-acetyl-ADP-ribose deacetylase (regulator of RNase III)
MIETASGNLLRAPVDALVNTVNCVGVMGKGIALQFKQAYPAMFEAYAKAAKGKAIVPGRMFVYETGSLVGPRLVINFPTKRHWKGNSRLEDIDAGLVDLVRVIEAREIRSIAIPPLGAGNGGLDWLVVRPRIAAALESLPDVRVLLFEPRGEPVAEERVTGTERPPLTVARALFLRLMDLYGIPDYAMTLLEVQKLAYFLQVAGEPLRLRFERAPYGPYADNLNQVLRRLEGHYYPGRPTVDFQAA